MLRMDPTARGLDLAARSIDLLTTLYGATNAPNTALRISTEIGRGWAVSI